MRTTHSISYPRFLGHLFRRGFEGSPSFYVAMTLLTAVALVGANAWAHQVVEGMALTGMTDHVSWGLYIANFTFGVGLAAGAVMMVIPAYLYDDHEMHDVVLIGELLAIAAILVCVLFIVVDMGRPDRFWHIIPGIGRFNWPISMLTWDVVVLNGYLLLNLHIAGYLMYQRFLGQKPRKIWYVPFVFLSIFWAISIHSVTAFLYSGLGGRPFWNSALLAPRFIASAFITGPAFVILLLQAVNLAGGVRVGGGPIRTLAGVLRITVLVNLFMLGSELFTSFYTGGHHAAAVDYLFWGSHGKSALVPWAWSSVALNVTSAVLLYVPSTRAGNRIWLNLACVCAFAGVWIEKGMGLIIPGFVPSTLHEVVEYVPTLTEWKVSAGIWAFGGAVLMVGLKLARPVLTGELSHDSLRPPSPASESPHRG
jgi:molybdopterin-containing oxidoreductase family membrane subunit